MKDLHTDNFHNSHKNREERRQAMADVICSYGFDAAMEQFGYHHSDGKKLFQLVGRKKNKSEGMDITPDMKNYTSIKSIKENFYKAVSKAGYEIK